MKTQRGFTLIEMLIAITLMAIVSLLSWRGLEAVARANERAIEDGEANQAILRTLGQLGRDLRERAPDAAFPAEPVAAGVVVPPRLLPGSLAVDASAGGAPVLNIVRAAPAQDGTWQQIDWRLDGNMLRRVAGVPTDVLPLAEPVQAVDVLDRVNQLRFRAWVPGRGWVALPAPQGTQAATGLEIAIARGENETYRHVVVFE